MKFLLDENADIRIAAYLTERGHDVRIFALEYGAGSADDKVLEIAHLEARILITNDLDFGDLVFRKGLPHTGVILFRLRCIDLTTKVFWLDRILSDYSERLDNFLVVSESGIRTRRARRP